MGDLGGKSSHALSTLAERVHSCLKSPHVNHRHHEEIIRDCLLNCVFMQGLLTAHLSQFSSISFIHLNDAGASSTRRLGGI